MEAARISVDKHLNHRVLNAWMRKNRLSFLSESGWSDMSSKAFDANLEFISLYRTGGSGQI